MADGDFTIPTYLGTPGNHHRTGLEGKDAVLIQALNEDRSHSETNREVRSEGRDIARNVFENRVERERDVRELAVELQKLHGELGDKIHREGERTREMVTGFRLSDQAAEIAYLRSKLPVTVALP